MTDVIDMDVVDELLSLCEEGDPELLIDLIRMYLADGPQKLADITEGLARQDFERVERAAHSLKGAAGNLGAIQVQADCEELQVWSREQADDKVSQGVADLCDHFSMAESALQDILERYS